jgi:hypothetical protein
MTHYYYYRRIGACNNRPAKSIPVDRLHIVAQHP